MVVLRFIRRDKEEKKYLLLTHESGLHGRKRRIQMTLLSQVRVDFEAITKKKEVVDVAADVVAEEIVTIPHKLMKMPTLGRKRV